MSSVKTWLANNIGVMCGCGVLLGSLALNVALGFHIRQITSPRMAGNKVGSAVTSIILAESLNGSSQIVFHGKRTVLYIMSPTCVWCARNIQNIRAIGDHYHVIGLSTTADKLSEYRANNPLPFEIVVPDSTRLPKWLDLGATPQTVVVNESGVIEKAWVGALDGTKKAEAEKFFEIALPGLVEVPHLAGLADIILVAR